MEGEFFDPAYKAHPTELGLGSVQFFTASIHENLSWRPSSMGDSAIFESMPNSRRISINNGGHVIRSTAG